MDCRLPSPSLSPDVCSNSCPSSWRWHPTTSSSVALFSSCPQSFPSSESFAREGWMKRKRWKGIKRERGGERIRKMNRLLQVLTTETRTASLQFGPLSGNMQLLQLKTVGQTMEESKWLCTLSVKCRGSWQYQQLKHFPDNMLKGQLLPDTTLPIWTCQLDGKPVFCSLCFCILDRWNLVPGFL